MRTRDQVMSLLSVRRPASESDRKSIVEWCGRRNLKVYFPGSRDDGYHTLEAITTEQFTEWFKTPHHDTGEVITAGDGSVYLITGYAGGASVSGAHLDSSGLFSPEPVEVDRSPESRASSDDEKKALQRAMNKADLTWNPFRGGLMSGCREEKKHCISVWVLGEKVGKGIYREVDKDGNLVMYCFSRGEDHLELGNRFVLGPADDYAIREASKEDRSAIVEELNSAGMCWHGKLKRMEPLRLRRPSGGRYYYIASCGRVSLSVERKRTLDENRFRYGNYFLSKEEAEAFKRHLILARNSLLIGKLDTGE